MTHFNIQRNERMRHESDSAQSSYKDTICLPNTVHFIWFLQFSFSCQSTLIANWQQKVWSTMVIWQKQLMVKPVSNGTQTTPISILRVPLICQMILWVMQKTTVETLVVMTLVPGVIRPMYLHDGSIVMCPHVAHVSIYNLSQKNISKRYF